MAEKIACSNCLHYGVCGEASPYNDATQYKRYINTREYKLLCDYKAMYERSLKTIDEMNADLDKAKAEIQYWKQSFENQEADMIRLKAIKKALEVLTGRSFDN